ncbi:ParB/RepB/Spo0J family partition protein [Ruegeria lacuscaerulensis]|uniref:ParB/RepB/Spo0J family partition protein n=1 Tax=Ruegeria lacuscaerulensis TaxID=55218 RepID=UPI00147E98F8|nr:ParB N-terminal domain-containing protein [Ruegeria lacuscaerulensis]
MAKRRRLTAPDATALQEMEEGFAAKPQSNPFETNSLTPPIAQVAAEAAALSGMAAVTDRAALAQDQGDAERWRLAQSDGLVAHKVALDEVEPDYIRRDRLDINEEEMAELIESIRAHGLRTPIEVTGLEDGYGLISGYRRFEAFRRLAATDSNFAEIPAFIRDAGAGQGAYVSMVEENELRSNLSHYERGRIAVLAAGQGVFDSVEDAVNALFSTASKAKRSKVRSFAVVHEALGDLLQFPTELTEKAGLQLAAGLRNGAQARFREALDGAEVLDARSEWKLLEQAAKDAPVQPVIKSRGGRPQQVERIDPVALANGGSLSAEVAPGEVRIRVEGRSLDREAVEVLLRQLADHIG